MIPYYKELDKPDSFPIYLSNPEGGKTIKNVYNSMMPDNYYKQIGDLQKELPLLCFLARIEFYDESAFHCNSYEEWSSLGCSYLELPSDFFDGRFPTITKTSDEIDFLKLCSDLAGQLKRKYFHYEDRLNNIIDKASDLIKFLSIHSNIVFENEKYLEYNWYNSWCITPTGHLYNTGSKEGHKSGNLLYYFWDLINMVQKDDDLFIPSIDDFNHEIERIIKRGFVSEEQFKSYSNCYANFINIVTKEVNKDRLLLKEFYRYAREQQETDYFLDINDLYNKYFNGEEPVPIRSYQKNIITLVLGHLYAKRDYYTSLLKVPDCNRKRIFKEILTLVDYDIKEFLIRYCGFSIIDTCTPKTIITSRIRVYEDFYYYLINGWDINIIPPIVYDSSNDKIFVRDNLIYHYLDKENYPDFKKNVKILQLSKKSIK